MRTKPLVAGLPLLPLLLLLACGGGGGGARVVGDLTLTAEERWEGETVVVTGTLTVGAGGHLVLDGATVRFEPDREDFDAFVLEGDGRLSASGSRLESGSGKQWNLEARDAARIDLVDTIATNHSGIRGHDQVWIHAAGGDVEELQVHDEVQLELSDGASAYVVLFFSGDYQASLTDGELAVGHATRSFEVATGPGTSGSVSLDEAEVYGWQLDLEEGASLTVAGGREIVLAMHLRDVARVVTEDLTADAPGDGGLDFSAEGGPAFAYSDTHVRSFNLYAEGACDLDFQGRVDVTEPNVADTSVVTFGAETSLWANLAQTYGDAVMTFAGVTLLEDDGSHPSFTAEDSSTIRIQGVDPTPGTRLHAIGGGRVEVTGGSGWSWDMVEELDLEGQGGVTIEE